MALWRERAAVELWPLMEAAAAERGQAKVAAPEGPLWWKAEFLRWLSDEMVSLWWLATFFHDVNHGCFKHSFTVGRQLDHRPIFLVSSLIIPSFDNTNYYLGSLVRVLRIKSSAWGEMSSKSSSGKSSCPWQMFWKVSWSVSPPKGVKPVSKTYAITPTDLSVMNLITLCVITTIISIRITYQMSADKVMGS